VLRKPNLAPRHASLGGALTTLLVESTLNVGRNGVLATGGPQSSGRETPSFHAEDIGLVPRATVLRNANFRDEEGHSGRIGECNAERHAERATSDQTLVPQTLKEK
jgi:hypothetical protein